MWTRRSLILGAGLTGCRRERKVRGFAGYAFVANSDGRAVAAVDLTAFAVVRHIALERNPTVVVTTPEQPVVWALAGDLLYAIDAEKLRVMRKLALGEEAAALYLGPGGILIAASGETGRLWGVDGSRMAVRWRATLSGAVADADSGPEGTLAEGLLAVSVPAAEAVVIVDAKTGRMRKQIPVAGEPGLVRFRRDGKYLLVGERQQREMVIWDLAADRLVVRLPLAVRPDHVCVKDDGGQVFLAGGGSDAVVTVYPYQTEVGSITLAGRAPGFMAASRSPAYLFVANPESNDVTIVNIARQRVLAVTPVGREPCFLAVTPNDEYVLVLNRQSGDMAVLHLGSIVARRTKSAPLFTMVPVGSRPACAVVRAI